MITLLKYFVDIYGNYYQTDNCRINQCNLLFIFLGNTRLYCTFLGFTVITFCLLFTFLPEIRSYTFHRNKRQDLTLEQILDRSSAQKQIQGQNLLIRPNQWSSTRQEGNVGNFVSGLDPGFSSNQELTNGQNLAVNNFQGSWK